MVSLVSDKQPELPPAIKNPRRQAMLLAALYIAQEQYGWLSPEAIKRVAERLKLPQSQVKATASFYTMFRTEPRGKFHIQVCEGLSCYLVGGAEPIIYHVMEKLKIKPGEKTPDNKFTLEVVQCLAACGTAPAIKINDELYEQVTLSEIDTLLEKLAALDN